MRLLDKLAGTSALAWAYPLAGDGGFWLTRPRLPVEPPRLNLIHAHAPQAKIVLVRNAPDALPALHRVLGRGR